MHVLSRRTTAVAATIGVAALLTTSLAIPALAKKSKPPTLPNLTAKLLTADGVGKIVDAAEVVAVANTTADAKNGTYLTKYSEGSVAMPRWMVSITEYTKPSGGGGGGGGTTPPPNCKCETVQNNGPKVTTVCYGDMMVMTNSGWTFTVNRVKWTVAAPSTLMLMLMDMDTGEQIELTDAVKDHEAKNAMGLRDAQKAKDFG